jgi:hypothetical protein
LFYRLWSRICEYLQMQPSGRHRLQVSAARPATLEERAAAASTVPSVFAMAPLVSLLRQASVASAKKASKHTRTISDRAETLIAFEGSSYLSVLPFLRRHGVRTIDGIGDAGLSRGAPLVSGTALAIPACQHEVPHDDGQRGIWRDVFPPAEPGQGHLRHFNNE